MISHIPITSKLTPIPPPTLPLSALLLFLGHFWSPRQTHMHIRTPCRRQDTSPSLREKRFSLLRASSSAMVTHPSWELKPSSWEIHLLCIPLATSLFKVTEIISNNNRVTRSNKYGRAMLVSATNLDMFACVKFSPDKIFAVVYFSSPLAGNKN